MSDFELPEEHLMDLDIEGVRRISLICTDADLHELVFGFLRNEGIIASCEDVEHWDVNPTHTESTVRLTRQALARYCAQRELPADLRPSGLGGHQLRFDLSIPSSDDEFVLTNDQLRAYGEQMDEHAVLHKRMGGVHCSALFSEGELLSVFEDIGRHNTLDKISGDLLIRGVEPGKHCVLVTTGRISSDMARKAACLGASVICSYSVATKRAFDAAQAANLTLVAYLGRRSMRVLCGYQRVAIG